MRLLVTGGAGFIASNFIRLLLEENKAEVVVNLDKLTYAGGLDTIADLQKDKRHVFVKGDVCDEKLVAKLLKEHSIEGVLNFAAESHVDRSITSSKAFIQTNVEGTRVLLDASLNAGVKRFLQVSTDEVYGSLHSGSFKESDALNPSSPYSASKAAADLLALSYYATHGLNVLITRSTNNYGPFQHPEKFIPLFITNALEGKECPLYGSGSNVRDWIYVKDNCNGILKVFEKGQFGQVYNLGGGNERPNLQVAKAIVKACGANESLIKRVADRKGHDFRYSVDSTKAAKLGFAAKIQFEKGLQETVDWFKAKPAWWKARKGA